MSGGAGAFAVGAIYSNLNNDYSTDEDGTSVSSIDNHKFIQQICETISGIVVGKYSSKPEGLNEALLEGRMLLGEKLREQDTKLQLGDLDVQTYYHTHLCHFYETHGRFEALLSGKHHRVYGVRLPVAKGRLSVPWIIRVPHSERSSLMSERGIVVLQNVQNFANIPVPRVIAYSFNPESSLASAWSLQSMCAGSDLCSNDMNYWMLEPAWQAVIAAGLGKILRKLIETSFTSPGELTVIHSSSGATALSIEPFPVYVGLPPSTQRLEDSSRISKSPSISEWLIFQLNRWRAAALPEHTEVTDYIDCLIQVVNQMNRMGLFTNNKFSLCHLDLHPRNIIVKRAEYDIIRISGIVDWDSAVVAPSFAQCTPPSWLWHCGADFSTDDGGPRIDHFPVDQPLYPEHRALRVIFENAAGPEYFAYAYNNKYRLARVLFRFALNGIYEALYLGDVDQFLSEWNVARDRNMPAITRPSP